jgi:hypothetical protein
MRCQIIFTDPTTKEWSVNDIKHIDEIGSRFGMSDVAMDRMEAAIGGGEFFTLPDARFAAYPLGTSPGEAPEVIEGCEQFRAGFGRIVTDWHNNRAEAVADFHRQRANFEVGMAFFPLETLKGADECRRDAEEYSRECGGTFLP